ncbi:unnamed protein product [Urochloa humidicola]
MLMTAALHLHMDMESAARGVGPSPSSTSTSPPCLPAALADDNHRHHQLPYGYDLAASAPSPTNTTRATAAPPNHLHHHLRPARRVNKNKRPSRKLPTTYITADPASFRRMVHQVTGADDLPAPPPAATLCRPASSRAAPGGAMLLPTLDTSAFLPGVLPAAAPALVEQHQQVEAGGVRPAAAGACSNSNYNGSSFPTLDSWDPLF